MVTGCGGTSVPMRKVLETEHFEVWREIGLPDACTAPGNLAESLLPGLQRQTKRKITYKQYDHIQATQE
jgi:hypothetical protein